MKPSYALADLAAAYIRPADAGGVTLALTATDPRAQTFNVSVAKIVTLPTTGVLAGEVWLIENVGTANVTVQSSGGTTLANVLGTKCFARALIAAPTTAAHWTIFNPGEVITAAVQGVNAAASNTNVQVLSITVLPGKWKISGTLVTNRSLATIAAGNQNLKYSLTTTSAADGTGRGKELYPVNGALPIDYTDMTLPVHGYSVNVTVATTYYLNAANKYTAGTPNWDAYLEAVREC